MLVIHQQQILESCSHGSVAVVLNHQKSAAHVVSTTFKPKGVSALYLDQQVLAFDEKIGAVLASTYLDNWDAAIEIIEDVSCFEVL